nr:oleate hydratase [Sulfurovum indicum]
MKGDRQPPDVVPQGSVNLAFLRQFAEIEGDCIFTIEYSVHSAMMTIYSLLNLEKNPPNILPQPVRHPRP